MRRDTQRRSRGLFGFVERHRVATTFLALFLVSSPARPDDRQLLQANAGAPANVLIILDSSYSMNNEFSDTYRLPAFLDDFIYPEGTTSAVGSKFAVAKRVLRKVMTSAAGVNWAFSTYRNPDPTFGNTSFNGLIFTSSNFNLINSITIGATTNLAGFDLSRVSIVDDELRLNFAGLTYNTDTVIGLSFTPVPEPATWAMMLLGFGAVGFAMRRRKRTELALRQIA